MKERTIIVGDVHGCLDELKTLLKNAQFDPTKDRLIFLGDLINKGPDSVGVVTFVKDNAFECIMGNHELGFLKSLEDPAYFNKGFKKFYEDLGDQRDEVILWLKKLPLFIEGKDFICIHGGLEPNVSLKNQKKEVATRIRTWGQKLNEEGATPWYEFYKEEKLIVYGHWAAQGLLVRDNTIGLDSGCVWGGALSALLLPQREIIQVKAFEQYSIP